MLLQAMHKKVQKTKMEQNFNPGLALIGLFRNRAQADFIYNSVARKLKGVSLDYD